MTIAMQATAYNIPQPGNPKMRLRDEGLTETDRKYAVGMHLLSLISFLLSGGLLTVLGPLVLWLIRKDRSPFDDDHGREVINFGISFMLWGLLAGISIFVGIGFILLPALWIVVIVNNIRGAIAAGNGEYFRYPMTIRFLS
ncbi:MAG: DUF4870 domain-containing protein [Planctomycetes bacterium]|nr:DUF4870 domain-containing protein [Planctomycetota bacterium]